MHTDLRMRQFAGELEKQQDFRSTWLAHQNVLERRGRGDDPCFTVVVEPCGRRQFRVRVRTASVDIDAYGSSALCLERLADRLQRRAFELTTGFVRKPNVACWLYVIAEIATQCRQGQLGEVAHG